MARTFDGTDDQISFGSEAAVDNLHSGFTGFILLRTTANVTTERQVFTKMNSSFAGKMYLALFGNGSGDNQFFVLASRASAAAVARSGINAYLPNAWYALASVWDGTNAPKLYHCALGGEIAEPGAYLEVSAGSGLVVSDDLATVRVAARDPLDASFYSGGAAEVALWNRVLSLDELRALGRGFAPAFFPRGRVLYSLIDGRTSPERNWAGTTHGTVTGTTYLDHPPVIYPSYAGVRKPQAAPSFNAAWARGSNVLLGVGAR